MNIGGSYAIEYMRAVYMSSVDRNLKLVKFSPSPILVTMKYAP